MKLSELFWRAPVSTAVTSGRFWTYMGAVPFSSVVSPPLEWKCRTHAYPAIEFRKYMRVSQLERDFAFA